MQTSYDAKPAIGKEGMIADSRIMRNVISRISSGVIKAGRGVFRASSYTPGLDSGNPGQIVQAISPVATLDVDAIATGTVIKSVVAGVTYLAAVANGAVGADEMIPPRRLTVTFDASTDWDPGAGSISFLDENGELVTEALAVATSAALTTTAKARSFVGITLPAATGTGGTATIGIAALAFTLADFEGVAVYDASVEPPADAIAAVTEYGDDMAIPVLETGAIYVLPETAVVPTDTVYVRVAAGAGGSDLGAFGNTADTATCVAVTNAKWGSKASADALAILILR
jgi:hypothetical protein